jgi:hypothetical protein
MSSTMLQLVQQVTNELGVTAPVYVAGNTNQDVTQILALMNATGYELLRRHNWRAMTKQKAFYTAIPDHHRQLDHGSQDDYRHSQHRRVGHDLPGAGDRH